MICYIVTHNWNCPVTTPVTVTARSHYCSSVLMLFLPSDPWSFLGSSLVWSVSLLDFCDLSLSWIFPCLTGWHLWVFFTFSFTHPLTLSMSQSDLGLPSPSIAIHVSPGDLIKPHGLKNIPVLMVLRHKDRLISLWDGRFILPIACLPTPPGWSVSFPKLT